MPINNESITLRIEKALLENLRKIALERRVNVNTLCSEVLYQYERWNANASSAGMWYFPKELLKGLIDRMSDDEIIQMADSFATEEVKGKLLILRNEFSVSAFLDAFTWWLQISGMRFKYDIDEDWHMLILIHEMGRKWSFLLKSLLQATFSKFGHRIVDFDYTDTMLVFRIRLRDV